MVAIRLLRVALLLSPSPPPLPLLSSCRELIYMHDNNVSTPIQGNFWAISQGLDSLACA